MFFCLVFVMPLCASVYLCLVVTCWERTDFLALVCVVCHIPICILDQVWYLIVSIPELYTLLRLVKTFHLSISHKVLFMISQPLQSCTAL